MSGNNGILNAAEARLASHIARLQWSDLGEAERAACRKLLADAVGCTVAGLASPECRRLSETLAGRGGSAEASVAGCDTRLPAPAAAVLNATLGHWYEWDDVHDPSALHPGIVIWPVLLATAEAEGLCQGGGQAETILATAAAAYDVAVALGRGLLPHLVTGWMPTGIACTIAAAGAAMRLRGGDEAMIWSAMGIAAAGVGLSRQPLDARVNGKNVLCALAASRAMEAVDLALAGVDGAPDYLDGPFGIVKLATGGRLDAFPSAELVPGAAAVGTSIKVFPSCRSTHPAVDLARSLHGDVPGIAGKAERISVRVPRPMAELCGKPFIPVGDVRVAAQFSIPYCVAVALTRGDLAAEDFATSMITADVAVLDLARRVDVEPYELSPGQPILGSMVSMTVTTRDGHEHRREDDRISGSPAMPLGDAGLESKFLACANGFLGSERTAAALYDALLHFDTIGLARPAELLRSASPHNSAFRTVTS